MRSKVRAYSHQGHGPRAEQQAGYISATSDSTPSVANGSRSIHRGHEDQFPLPRLRVRYVLAEPTFDRTRVNGCNAPTPAIRGTEIERRQGSTLCRPSPAAAPALALKRALPVNIWPRDHRASSRAFASRRMGSVKPSVNFSYIGASRLRASVRLPCSP